MELLGKGDTACVIKNAPAFCKNPEVLKVDIGSGPGAPEVVTKIIYHPNVDKARYTYNREIEKAKILFQHDKAQQYCLYPFAWCEVHLMTELDKQNIANVNGVCKFEGYAPGMLPSTIFLLEMQNGGTTLSDLESKHVFRDDESRSILAQIRDCLYFLHHRGLSHGDVKNSNIVIDLPTLKVKLIDFEEARPITDDVKDFSRAVLISLARMTEPDGPLNYKARLLSCWRKNTKGVLSSVNDVWNRVESEPAASPTPKRDRRRSSSPSSSPPRGRRSPAKTARAAPKKLSGMFDAMGTP